MYEGKWFTARKVSKAGYWWTNVLDCLGSLGSHWTDGTANYMRGKHVISAASWMAQNGMN